MNVPSTLAEIEQEWPSASEADQRLIEFVASLIFDLAHTHPRVSQKQTALWVAQIAMGTNR